MQSRVPALMSLTDGARRVLAWWGNELVGLVPERIQRLFADADAHIVLAQVETGFQIIEGSAPPARGKAGATLSRAQAVSALAEMGASRRPRAIGIRLPLSQCFERWVELPKAAPDDVRRMLDFDLERATPFRPSEVYTAHLMTDGAGAKGKQRLRQLVVKREAVDPLIADVRAAGLEPAFVDCWQTTPSSSLPVDFLEARAPRRSGLGRYVTLPRALAFIAMLLVGLASLLWVSKYEAALAELRAVTATKRTQATAVRNALEGSEAAVADLRRLQQMKLRKVPVVEILDELSKVLPDWAWLTDLRIEGDIVDITGLAKSGAALPSLFQRSALFVDASLTAPLTLDPREDKERFSLRIRIKQPEASRPPAASEGGL